MALLVFAVHGWLVHKLCHVAFARPVGTIAVPEHAPSCSPGQQQAEVFRHPPAQMRQPSTLAPAGNTCPSRLYRAALMQHAHAGPSWAHLLPSSSGQVALPQACASAAHADRQRLCAASAAVEHTQQGTGQRTSARSTVHSAGNAEPAPPATTAAPAHVQASHTAAESSDGAEQSQGSLHHKQSGVSQQDQNDEDWGSAKPVDPAEEGYGPRVRCMHKMMPCWAAAYFSGNAYMA